MKREIFLKKINLTGCPYTEAEKYRLGAIGARQTKADVCGAAETKKAASPCVWLTDDTETLEALEQDGECVVYLLTPHNRDRFCPQAKWCVEVPEGFCAPQAAGPDAAKQNLVWAETDGSDLIDPDFLWRVWLRRQNLPWQICETDRLYLREMTEDDLDFLYQCRQDEQSARFVAGPTADRQTETEKLAAYRKLIYGFYGFGLWMVCEKNTGEPVGRAGLQIREDSELLELGFETAAQYRGRGYAREAVEAVLAYAQEELEQDKLCVWVEEENLASQRLCSSLGFTETKRMTKDEKHWIVYHAGLGEDEI